MDIVTEALFVAGVTCMLAAACGRDRPRDDVVGQPVDTTGATVSVGPPEAGMAANDPSAGALGSIAAAPNAGMVTRFADEVSITPIQTRIRASTTVRTMPLGGGEVASFDHEADVTLLAKKGGYYLVLLSDPADEGLKLAGWVYRDGVEAAAETMESTAPSTFTCKSGEVGVMSAGICAKTCSRDAECVSVGGVCDGNGPVAEASGAAGRARYCVVAPQQ